MLSVNRTATSQLTPIDSSSASSATQASKATATLNTADVFSKAAQSFSAIRRVDATTAVFGADKDYLVSELDSADKLAGLAFLCLREGDYARAQQYMQEATDIRKAVEPKLTESQQVSLEKIMSLQQDAYDNLSSGNWLTRIFGQIKAAIDLSQAAAESAKLRNSILSEGQLKAAL